MDPYEQYLADVEYENYLQQVQAPARPPPVPTAPQTEVGPDYERSFLQNAGDAITELPAAAMQFGGDLYSFLNPFADGGAGGPIDTIRRAGIEQTAQTGGGLATGTAGAMALAPLGAAWGSLGGPLGALAGGAVAGGAGFGAGLLGFNLATDATQEAVNAATGENLGPGFRPVDQYGKDLVYNSIQGAAFGGASEAGLAALRAARGAPSRLASPFTKEGADARVATKLQDIEPGLQGKLGSSLWTQDPFLDYKSLGELVDSAPLKSAQRSLARAGPMEYGRQTEANALRNDAQLKYLDQIETSPMTLEDVQNSIRGAQDAKLTTKLADVDVAGGKVGEALADLPLPIDALEAGSTMRDLASGNKDALRGQVTQSFEGGKLGFVDPAPVQAVAEKLMPNYFKEVGAQPNGELVQLIKDLSKQGEATGLLDAQGQPIVRPAEFTLQDTQALRSKALDIANGSDKRTAGVAREIANALTQAEDAAVKAGSVPPEALQSLREGRALRKEQGVTFESDATPTKSVLAKQPYGEFRVPESAVPSKYFRPGDKGTRESIRNYKKAIGTDESALEPLYRYATDSFRDYVVKDGKVDGTKARKWLERHSSALDEIPELRQQLSNVDNAQRFLNEKYGDLQRTQVEVEKGALKQFLQVDPDKAISAMLSGRDMVKRTISTVQYLKANDADALAGLRRGVIEHLKQKSYIPDGKVTLEEASIPGGAQFDGTVRGGVLKAEWEKIRPALERSKLFTDSQMKGFDYIYKDKASQLSIEKAKMPGGSDTAQNQSTLAYFVSAARNGFLKAVLPGPTKYISGILEPLLKSIPEAKFQASLEEALLNPRVARDLLAKANSKNVTRAAQQMFQRELAQVIGSTATGGTDRQDVPAITTPPKQLVPKQAQVLSKKSFPKPQELLAPPAPGMLKKTSFDLSPGRSFDVKSFVKEQSPETRARISTESSGDPWALSKKGAQGLSQLMPDTAQDIAAKLGEVYMPLRPGMSPEEQQLSIEQNVRFGDHYLNVMLPQIDKAFKNKTLAWAAYNAGPRRVREAMAMAGSSTDVNKILSNLPQGVQKETIPYVNRIATKYGNV